VDVEIWTIHCGVAVAKPLKPHSLTVNKSEPPVIPVLSAAILNASAAGVEAFESMFTYKLSGEFIIPFPVPTVTVPPRADVPFTVRVEKLAVVEKRSVDEATDENKLVVVALVPVALIKVKFWSVDDPVTSKFESVVKPPVAVMVPVKLAAEEMVWLLIAPDVMAPVVREPDEDILPVLSEVEKRLVEEAVVEKKLVEVALVEVDW
jgi:hypothetical protein